MCKPYQKKNEFCSGLYILRGSGDHHQPGEPVFFGLVVASSISTTYVVMVTF